MGKMSFKERQKQARENEILKAASELMLDHLTTTVSMDEVAEKVGISKPTIYQHFKSKDDMVARTLIRGMEMLEAHLSTPQPGTPIEQLEAIVRMLHRERNAPDGLLAGMATELVIAIIRTHPTVGEHKQRTNALLSALIEAGKAAGEIREDISTPMIISWMFCSLGAIQGAYIGMDASGWRDRLDSQVEQIARAFIRGIATGQPSETHAKTQGKSTKKFKSSKK